MEDKTDYTFYDLLSPKEIVDELQKSINNLFSDEYKNGAFKIPDNIPKDTKEKIYRLDLLIDILKIKMDNEEDENF